MKKLFLSLITAGSLAFNVNAAETECYFNDWVNSSTTITFTSGDIAEFETSPGNSSTNNLCAVSGVVKRIQANHLILHVKSLDNLRILTINANSSSSSGSSRTIRDVKKKSSSSAEWEPVTGWVATHLPTGTNSDTTCGTIELTGINIAKDEIIRIEFATYDTTADPIISLNPQNVRLIKLTLSDVGTAIKNVSLNSSAFYVNNNTLRVENAKSISLYSVTGAQLSSIADSEMNLNNLSKGVYVAIANINGKMVSSKIIR